MPERKQRKKTVDVTLRDSRAQPPGFQERVKIGHTYVHINRLCMSRNSKGSYVGNLCNQSVVHDASCNGKAGSCFSSPPFFLKGQLEVHR